MFPIIRDQTQTSDNRTLVPYKMSQSCGSVIETIAAMLRQQPSKIIKLTFTCDMPSLGNRSLLQCKFISLFHHYSPTSPLGEVEYDVLPASHDIFLLLFISMYKLKGSVSGLSYILQLLRCTQKNSRNNLYIFKPS